VGSGEGLCPPQLVVWGLAPETKKKQFCAKNYAILNDFRSAAPIVEIAMQLHITSTSEKVGELSPVLKVGAPTSFPCPPCFDAYGHVLSPVDFGRCSSSSTSIIDEIRLEM